MNEPNPSIPAPLVWRRWLIPAAAVIAVTAAAAAAYPLYSGYLPFAKSKSGTQITALGRQAFGSLALNGAVKSGSSLQTASADSALSAPNVATGTVSTGSSNGSSGVMIPATASLQYVYAGPTVTQPDSTLDVLRWKLDNEPAASTAFGSLGSLLDKSVLDKATVQQISFSQGTNSYQISLDFSSGRLTVQRNQAATDKNSFTSLAPKDLPSDETLTKISDDFLGTFGISRSQYDSPRINHDTLVSAVPMLETTGPTTITEASPLSPYVTVLYPLLVNGRHVYDQSGGLVGMDVVVDAVSKQVINLTAVQSSAFESSSYDAITDFDTIKATAESGGTQYAVRSGAEGSIQQVGLEKPEAGYLETSQYQDGLTQEYLVPAFIFPIKASDKKLTYVSAVVVPLVKGVVDQGAVIAPTPAAKPLAQ